MSPLAAFSGGFARQKPIDWRPLWHPWGPCGLPPCMEELMADRTVSRCPGIRRARSWAGYALFQDQEAQPASVNEASESQALELQCDISKELERFSDDEGSSGRPTTSTCAGESGDFSDQDAGSDDLLCEGSFEQEKMIAPVDDYHFMELPKARHHQELSPAVAVGQDVAMTTLMIQNLPRKVTRDHFTAEMDKSGFSQLYDFCYLPRTFSTRCNRGFAFVNFVSEKTADSFAELWQHSRRFGMKSDHRPLVVTRAEIQGFQANAKLAASKKMGRVKNGSFRPLVVNCAPTC